MPDLKKGPPSAAWAGAAMVVAGALAAAALHPAASRASAPAEHEPHVIDLAAGGAATLMMGSPNKDQLGNDLVLGDVNDDGLLDILAGAQWSSAAGRNIVGRAYVVFGRDQWPDVLDMATGAADWSFFGAGREARMGSAVSAADWDGDGRTDVLLGSLLADQLDQHNGGAVYLMRGGPAAGGHIDFLRQPPDALLVGDSRRTDSDQLGNNMATGDFNGDGFTDIAVSAAFRDRETGAVFVWFGPIDVGAVHNLRHSPADWTILGPEPNSWFGSNLTAGDITGDGLDDLVVSSLALSPSARADVGREPDDSGAVFVVAGNEEAGGVLDLSLSPAHATIVGRPGSKLGMALAVGTCGCTGQSLAVADVTGNGQPDLVIGAPMENRFAGSVTVLAGPLAGGTVDLSASEHLHLPGAAAGDRFGWSLQVGDLGGGSGSDLVVAAPWATAADRAGGGLVLAYRGPLPAREDPERSARRADLVVLGPEAGAGNRGCSLAIGDTDGDAVDDLHIGLPDSAPRGRRSAGAVFRLRGPLLEALPAPSPTGATPSVTATAQPSPTHTATTAPATETVAVPPTSSSPTPPSTATATDGPTMEPTLPPPQPTPAPVDTPIASTRVALPIAVRGR